MIVTVNDQKTYVAHLKAEAPPLVLLHGASGLHNIWLAAARAIDGADTYLPDLPAHGRSDGPPLESIPAMADFTLALLDALGLDRAVVGGHSMGGAVALELALRADDRISGVILCSTIARMRVNSTLMEAAHHDPHALAEFFATYAYGPSADADLVEQGRELIVTSDLPHGTDFAACHAFDARLRLPEATLPTLILCGREDKMTPAPKAQLMAEQMPNATLRIIDHGGHMLPIEMPGVVGDLISAWL